ncbi:hypothetical protein [Stenotrophomonas sp. Marseille-Q4652]|uniref:hypothetical protein n=1 Tax=Stenotrophomonas sp. Marseille-Q4652 TaxID=2866595 RepID=UPI001CE48FE0|nr:hypothetical protein [Stenotrophomonas sp. Marseille-Q4652]
MKTRRVYSTHDVEAAQHALQAARQHGVENDDLSLVARGDIELQQIPDDRKEARTDMLPAVARGALGGGAAGLLAGLVAIAVPPLGITLAGAGALTAAGALVGSWSSALMGSTVPDPVRRTFEEQIESGRILLVVDAEPEVLDRAETAITAAGATPLPYDAPSLPA